VEVDDKAKILSLLQAVVSDQHRHPIVIGECQIWNYEISRQLCAKVTPNSVPAKVKMIKNADDCTWRGNCLHYFWTDQQGEIEAYLRHYRVLVFI